MSSSSSSRNKEPKLSARNQIRFKKSSKNTNLLLREKTILKKALELSTLCENEVCVIHYDRNGKLVNTWPEDQSKVRDMAERFSKLSDREKLKKSTNLSQFLNKKLIDERKRSLHDKNEYKIFTEKILGFEGSLKNQLQVFQERLLYQQTTTEPDQSRLPVISEQNHNFPLSPAFFPKDLSSSSSSSSSLIEDPLMNFCPYDPLPGHQQQQQTQSFTNLLMSGDDMSTITDSLNHQRRSKFSIFVFNHETATFTQLPDSVSPPSFYQTYNLKLQP